MPRTHQAQSELVVHAACTLAVSQPNSSYQPITARRRILNSTALAARYLVPIAGRGLLLLTLIAGLFWVAHRTPGDATSTLRMNPNVEAAAVEAQRERLGLNAGATESFSRWLRSMATGEGGWSVTYERPAGPLLLRRAARTLTLSTLALGIAWCLALVAGLFASGTAPTARSRRLHGGIVRSLDLLAATLLSTPTLVLGLTLAAWAADTGMWPAGGLGDPDVPWQQRWRHATLPAATLAAMAWPVLYRHVRNALREALAAPWIRAARGRGIDGTRLLVRHALPATAATLLPLAGWSIGGLLSGTVVVETIFSWPGLGTLMVAAVLGRDLHLVAGATLLTGTLVLVANGAARACQDALDPRLRPAPRPTSGIVEGASAPGPRAR